MAKEDTKHGHETQTRSVDFTTIVLSLRHAALMALGLLEDEAAGEIPRDTHACRMQIDMLEVLKEKTDGNLSDDENKLLDSILYELRMAYVEHAHDADTPAHDA